MSKILKFICNDNHSAAIGLLIAGIITAVFYGCDSKIGSFADPAKKLTRPELEAEYQYVTAQFAAKFTALDRQDLLRQMVLDQASVITSGGGFNPTGLIPLALAALGIGFGLDGRRKALLATPPPATTNNT